MTSKEDGTLTRTEVLALVFMLTLVTAILAAPVWWAPRHAGDDGMDWVRPAAAFDAALARGDVPAARESLQRAADAAARANSWESLLAVGGAQSRLAAACAYPTLSTAGAEENYRAALLLARRQHSLEGVMRATSALRALGDPAAAAIGIGIAERMAPAAGTVPSVRAAAAR